MMQRSAALAAFPGSLFGRRVALAATTLGILASSAMAVRPLGIDVSAWQGYRSQANWNSAFADGRVFAMIRVTHYYVSGTESDSHGNPDWYYSTNLPFARNAGFIAGPYHYARPTLRTPAVEGEYFLTYARPYITSGYLRPMLDLEGETTPVVGATSLSDWANQWLAYVHRQTGVKGMVYCNYNWAHNYLGGIDTSYPLAFARWSCPGDIQTDVPRLDNGTIASTSPWSTWTFWQYCGGPVAGFSGDIDLDVFNGTYDGLRTHVIGTGITNVQAAGVTGSAATITWTTDAASTSRVEYGLTTSYGAMTPLDSNTVTGHSVNLSGLAFNRMYHYRVISANPSWPTANVSSDFTFTTSNCSLVITQQPQPQSVCAGATAAFNVVASGGSTRVYQWQKYNGSTWDNVSDGGRVSGAATAALAISGVVGSDTGTYRCVVTADCGFLASNSVGLSLKAATAITQQPQPRQICPGATATFSVTATGDGSFAYQWQKNGADLSNGGHISGATAATLTVSTADAGDAGSYRCVVTAGCGSVTSDAADLAVKAATTITQDPQPVTANARAAATFTVAATGDGAVAYQWQKDAANLSDDDRISGATTGTLTISDLVEGDAGGYQCVVTAGCGSVTSVAAALVVNVPLSVATDGDGDGDVDLSDFSFLQMCFSGPNRPWLYPECDAADYDRDGDVDLGDFAMFQACFNGPNRTPSCP